MLHLFTTKPMNYKITREHKITLQHEDGWSYQFEADVFGGVTIRYIEHSSSGDVFKEKITVPKDDIQTFINTLTEFK